MQQFIIADIILQINKIKLFTCLFQNDIILDYLISSPFTAII